MPEHSPLEDFLAGIGQRFKNAQARHSKRMKGRSLQEIFESSIGAGFGAGSVGRVRGVPGIGIRLPRRGRDVDFDKDFPVEGVDPIKFTNKDLSRAKGKSNLNRQSSISEEGLRKNVGGKRPPDAELQALAVRKQSQLADIKKGDIARKAAARQALVDRTGLLERDPKGFDRLIELEEEMAKPLDDFLSITDARAHGALLDEFVKLLSSGKSAKPRSTKPPKGKK